MDTPSFKKALTKNPAISGVLGENHGAAASLSANSLEYAGAAQNERTAPAIHERKPHLTGWCLSAGDEHVVFDARHCQIVNVQCGAMTGRKYDEATDIARLIASAPELLAHLEFAVALLEPLIGGTAQLEALRAAITKAEG